MTITAVLFFFHRMSRKEGEKGAKYWEYGAKMGTTFVLPTTFPIIAAVFHFTAMKKIEDNYFLCRLSVI